MSEIQTTDWSETASANNQAPPNGWPEGQAPSTVNDCARAMMAAVKRDWNRTHPTVTSSGSSSALSLAYANAPTMADGLQFTFRLGTAIAAGAKLAINGGTALDLYWLGAAIVGGVFVTGDIVTAYYNATGPRLDIVSAPPRPISQGLHTLHVAASAMTPVDGAAPSAYRVKTTTNGVMVAGWAFDKDTVERLQFWIGMPKSWNAGTFTAQFGWTAPSGTGAVAWVIRALSLTDDDATDTAFGTGVGVYDTLTASGDLMISSVTGAITASNTPAKSDSVVFEVSRNAPDGGDNFNADAVLLWVKIFFSIDAMTDA